MEAYWNKLTLDRPPTTSWRCTLNEFDSNGFLKITEKVIQELESQTFLQTEAALLSRLIYRMKSKLRSDKGLKNMEKVNRALLNYLKLSLEKEYNYLRDNIECDKNIQILPSRQMLQYVLVRTQGFAKLMCRIENVAEKAGDFFKARISQGQAWNMSLVAYAVISRIWLLSRHLTKRCCNWYNKMYKYHDKLKIVGVSWLPENYYLPEDLKTWLYIPWIDEDMKNIPDEGGLSDGIFNLIKLHGDVEEDLEIDAGETTDTDVISPVVKSIEMRSRTKELAIAEVTTKNKIHLPPTSFDEIGQRVSRDEFAADLAKLHTKAEKDKIAEIKDQKDVIKIPLKKKSKVSKKMSLKNTKKSKVLNINNIKTKEDVMKFVSAESYPGLDKLQWNLMRKNVTKLLKKLNKCESNTEPKKRDILLKKGSVQPEKKNIFSFRQIEKKYHLEGQIGNKIFQVSYLIV